MRDPTIENIVFREEAILEELKSLKECKSPGPDEIPAKLIFELAQQLAKPLSFLCQKSFDVGILPTDWKTAHITPLYKSSSRALATNYRPVSLKSICCKVMEKTIKKELMAYLETHNLLFNAQYGFRKVTADSVDGWSDGTPRRRRRDETLSDTPLVSRRTVKAGAAIYEANRIAAAKVKREVRKSQLRPIRNAAAQPLPTCPRCQRAFRARIGLVGHLRTNCTSRTAPAIVPAPASSSSHLPPTNSDIPSAPPLPSSSFSSTAPAVAVQAAVSHIANHDTATATTPTCTHCDRTFTSHNGLVGHLRIHRTETGEPVPGAPTYTHRTRLHCPQCPRTFRHRMGLFGHMRIHESGIDRSLDTPTPPSPTPNPSPCAPTNHSPADIVATDLTTPHSPPSSSTSSFTATTTATPASVAHEFTTAVPDTTTGTTPATSINRCEGPDYICPHCDRTFT
nr:unnamed protein product [Spirometra erinaceieuropaei]